MALEELEKHLSIDNPNGCDYVTVKCPNESHGCGNSLLRKDLENHMKNTCLLREVKCIYCGESGYYNYITSENFMGHVWKCQEYPLECPRSCGTVRNLKRKDLKAHKEACPLEPVECPFREAGCKQQKLVRKDLDRHIKSSTQQHLLNLMDTNKTLMKKQKDLQLLESTVASVASELEALQTTVKDRSVASSLERITTTLNQVSLRLEKEGDQVIFQFPSNVLNWRSPAFQLTDSVIRMCIVLSLPSDKCKLSLLMLTDGKINGKYQINVNFQLEMYREEPFLLPFLPYFMRANLCTKCSNLPNENSKESKSGHEMANIYVSKSIMTSKPPLKCIVTVTLANHNC